MAVEGGATSAKKKKATQAPAPVVSRPEPAVGSQPAQPGPERGYAEQPAPEATPTPPAAPPDTGGSGDGSSGNSGSGASAPSGSGSGSGSSAPKSPPPTDWSTVLGQYGLPPDVVAELNKIWANAGSDPTAAITLAQAYVRGTQWYANTYPGIQQGINGGLFNDESGYRQYQNQVNQVFEQYYGRVATTTELSGYITKGQNVAQVANQFQAAAIKGNLSDPLKGLFTDAELTAYANEQAGIDTQLGQQITQKANLFLGVNNLYQTFYGRGVTRPELDTLTQNGTDAKTVAQQFATQSYVNDMNPAVSHLFTADEIRQMALEAAGGTTQNGKQLTDLANLATQLNPLYHQYTGDGVSRDEVNNAFQNGTTPTQIGNQLQGDAWAKANEADVQQTEGAQGTGPLSPTDLNALGEEQAGYDTPQGQAVLLAYQKAQQRLAGVFKGVLAHPALSVSGGRLQASSQQPPDVAA